MKSKRRSLNFRKKLPEKLDDSSPIISTFKKDEVYLTQLAKFRCECTICLKQKMIKT